ncbi:11815_t:CDS:1, partial [Acaulospora colombiana]
ENCVNVASAATIINESYVDEANTASFTNTDYTDAESTASFTNSDYTDAASTANFTNTNYADVVSTSNFANTDYADATSTTDFSNEIYVNSFLSHDHPITTPPYTPNVNSPSNCGLNNGFDSQFGPHNNCFISQTLVSASSAQTQNPYIHYATSPETLNTDSTNFPVVPLSPPEFAFNAYDNDHAYTNLSSSNTLIYADR